MLVHAWLIVIGLYIMLQMLGYLYVLNHNMYNATQSQTDD